MTRVIQERVFSLWNRKNWMLRAAQRVLSCFIAQAVSSRPGRVLARSGLQYRQRPLVLSCFIDQAVSSRPDRSSVPAAGLTIDRQSQCTPAAVARLKCYDSYGASREEDRGSSNGVAEPNSPPFPLADILPYPILSIYIDTHSVRHIFRATAMRTRLQEAAARGKYQRPSYKIPGEEDAASPPSRAAKEKRDVKVDYGSDTASWIVKMMKSGDPERCYLARHYSRIVADSAVGEEWQSAAND